MRKAAVFVGSFVLVILSLSSCSKKKTEAGAAGQSAGGASESGAVSGQPGETPGRGWLEVQGAHFQGHPIQTASGVAVGDVSNIRNSIPLPPGDYVIEVDGQKLPFTLREGERRTFERK